MRKNNFLLVMLGTCLAFASQLNAVSPDSYSRVIAEQKLKEIQTTYNTVYNVRKKSRGALAGLLVKALARLQKVVDSRKYAVSFWQKRMIDRREDKIPFEPLLEMEEKRVQWANFEASALVCDANKAMWDVDVRTKRGGVRAAAIRNSKNWANKSKSYRARKKPLEDQIRQLEVAYERRVEELSGQQVPALKPSGLPMMQLAPIPMRPTPQPSDTARPDVIFPGRPKPMRPMRPMPRPGMPRPGVTFPGQPRPMRPMRPMPRGPMMQPKPMQPMPQPGMAQPGAKF